MRSSTWSTEPICVNVPRPISAARVMRKLLGAEPMPTMNMRERPRSRRDGVEQLLLVADLAIGEEHDLAQDPLVLAVPVHERRLHGWHHFGATTRLQGGDEVFGVGNIVRICRYRVGEQHIHGVVEADDIEAVAGFQPLQGEQQARLGLHDRGAAHRAGIVDDEHDFTRLASFLASASRGGVTSAST